MDGWNQRFCIRMAYKAQEKMHTSTTLNRTFICERCNVVMLFESDRHEHERITGHSRFTIRDLAIGGEEMECGENS